jgi:hypothetical protein
VLVSCLTTLNLPWYQNSRELLDGYDANSTFIVSRDNNYFPTRSVFVEGDHKRAIVQIPIR